MLLKNDRIEEREYQRNIFESAKSANTLVVLPTGLGKTMISALMADHRLGIYPGTKILFVAPTKPLVNQHCKTFSHITTAAVGAISGDIDKVKRADIYSRTDVVFATPQTVEHDMLDGTVDFSKFSLLIVDEAHHAIGNYAYVKIAGEFMNKSVHPLILALTASPASDIEKIHAICGNLSITNVEIRGEDDPDVAPYIKSKTVEEVLVKLPKEMSDMLSSVRALISEQALALQGVGLMKNVPVNRINRTTILMLQKNLQRQMLSGNKTFYTIRGIIIISKLLKLYHAAGMLSTQNLESFHKFLHKIIKSGTSKTDKELANSAAIKDLYSASAECLSRGVEHPKLGEIKRILSENLKPNQRAIIFTQYRDTVDVIFSHIKGMENIRPVKFVGQNKGGLSQKEQINIIKDFEAGVYNVLISTSVSEEGMSIKGADLAVFYETVPSAIRSIQRRGRVGRFNAGRVFVLITEGTNDEGYNWVAKRKENKMRKLIRKIKDNPDNLKQDGTLKPFVGNRAGSA